MAKVIWFGDNRIEQLKRAQSDITPKDIKDKYSFSYITEEEADYSWFSSRFKSDMSKVTLTVDDSVVINLGFFDCLYSAIWPAYNVFDIAASYVKLLDTIVTAKTETKFYVASVVPVTDDYYWDAAPGGYISKNKLNDVIRTFNAKIKTSKAIFIDTASYLAAISFGTRDGFNFTLETCQDYQEYILSNLLAQEVSVDALLEGGTKEYKPRTTAPEKTNSYWINKSYGGKNACINIRSGSVLPNCVGYAWGRFYELLGEKPKLSTHNAATWFGHTADGYYRSKTTPELGAVACWSGGSTGAGHVAIVEKIEANGDCIISESQYNGVRFRYGVKLSPPNYTYTSKHHFQGFICPRLKNSKEPLWKSQSQQLITKTEIDSLVKDSKNHDVYWNSYDSRQQKVATYIYQQLSQENTFMTSITGVWSLNAIAGLLGNMQRESTLNPSLHERGGSGYGLVQWTPGTKLTKWCQNQHPKLNSDEIDSQLKRILYEFEEKIEWYPKTGFKLSFAEFMKSKKDPEWLAEAFMRNYERPGVTALEKRQAYARHWYDYLSQVAISEIKKIPPFIARAIHIDFVKIQTARASFIAYNALKYNYTLLQGTKKIRVKTDIKASDGVNTIDLTELIPNTDYTLKINIIPKEDTKAKPVTKTLKFTTQQDYPNAVSNVNITKASSGNFILRASKPRYIGYWEKNSHGYDIFLIVNGRVIKSVSHSGTSNLNISYDLKKTFNYEPLVDDCIQLGVQTWVKDNSGKKLTNKAGIIGSNTYCEISKPECLFIKIS